MSKKNYLKAAPNLKRYQSFEEKDDYKSKKINHHDGERDMVDFLSRSFGFRIGWASKRALMHPGDQYWRDEREKE